MKPEYYVLLALVVAGGACDSASSRTGTGMLEARWSGSDTGAVRAPAIAEWCAELQLLEIRAVRGDTGVALALFPDVVLSPDTYRVVPPTESVLPAARLGLRWFAPATVRGFQGDSGTVILERTDSGELTGSVVARARSVANSDRVTVTGVFRNLAIVPQMRGCTAQPALEAEAEDADPVDSDGLD